MAWWAVFYAKTFSLCSAVREFYLFTCPLRRTLKQFLGFKQLNKDKTVDYLTNSLSKRNVKNKPYKGKK